MISVNLRNYSPNDDSRIEEITRNAWRDVTIWKTLEDRFGVRGGKTWWRHKLDPLLAYAREHPERFIIAESEDRVVGYARFDMDDNTGIGIVMDNAVDPDYGGRGIGSAMHREVLRRMKSAGMDVARVSTNEHQVAARRLYEKHGFEEVHRTITYLRTLKDINPEESKK
jgi:ribosomal protein S18 acetylase RimI-like enzyme